MISILASLIILQFSRWNRYRFALSTLLHFRIPRAFTNTSDDCKIYIYGEKEKFDASSAKIETRVIVPRYSREWKRVHGRNYNPAWPGAESSGTESGVKAYLGPFRGNVMTKQWHVLIVHRIPRDRGWFGQISLTRPPPPSICIPRFLHTS